MAKPKQADIKDHRCGLNTVDCLPVTDEDFCFGCKFYVCSECDKLEPMGQHELDDHWNTIW